MGGELGLEVVSLLLSVEALMRPIVETLSANCEAVKEDALTRHFRRSPHLVSVFCFRFVFLYLYLTPVIQY